MFLIIALMSHMKLITMMMAATIPTIVPTVGSTSRRIIIAANAPSPSASFPMSSPGISAGVVCSVWNTGVCSSGMLVSSFGASGLVSGSAGAASGMEAFSCACCVSLLAAGLVLRPRAIPSGMMVNACP